MRKLQTSIGNAGNSFMIHDRNETASDVSEASRVDHAWTQCSTSSRVDPMTKLPAGITTSSGRQINGLFLVDRHRVLAEVIKNAISAT